LAALSNHWPIGFIGINSLVSQISLISVSGLIGHNGLVSFIGLGFVSFIGLGLVSLIGLTGHITGLISLILITTATARCTAHRVATMLGSADKICNAMILNYLAASLSIQSRHKINAAITKILQPKQAPVTHLELGVATSTIKIANAFALYFCATSLYYSYWFMRESWLWHVQSRLDSSSFGDALQNAKQLFFIRLSKMMK
jgi:hypothetical protein